MVVVILNSIVILNAGLNNKNGLFAQSQCARVLGQCYITGEHFTSIDSVLQYFMLFKLKCLDFCDVFCIVVANSAYLSPKERLDVKSWIW